jgi:ribosomal protein L37AE/L43A
METPVKPQDVKIVQGQSGKGLQYTCACGCVNWNHLEMSSAVWACRNCGRVLSGNFPALVKSYLALEKQDEEAAAPADSAASQ